MHTPYNSLVFHVSSKACVLHHGDVGESRTARWVGKHAGLHRRMCYTEKTVCAQQQPGTNTTSSQADSVSRRQLRAALSGAGDVCCPCGSMDYLHLHLHLHDANRGPSVGLGLCVTQSSRRQTARPRDTKDRKHLQ